MQLILLPTLKDLPFNKNNNNNNNNNNIIIIIIIIIIIAGPREARNPNLDSDQRIAYYVCAPCS